MHGIRLIDILVVLAYFAAIVYIGRRAKAASSKGEESYFLAGRKLGKLYQAFLNFGNATEPQGAVSNASFVYDKGAAHSWYSFLVIFINPYYWFMNVWFRRVRLLTMADLFVDRFNSRGMGVFYSLFQICVAVLLIGFGSFTAYTITASLVNKAPSSWTEEEARAVGQFREMRALETAQRVSISAAELAGLQAIAPDALTGVQRARITEITRDMAADPESFKNVAPLTSAQQQRLANLRDLKARDEIYSNVSVLRSAVYKWGFYLLFIAVVGAYMVLGGMRAAAVAEALQGTLIIVFSILLIPTGLYAIGGWSQLAERVPARMFDLFGGDLNLWGIIPLTLVGLIQMNALSPNMNIMGSAKNETAARMGVVGLYGKRLMIILWTFAGLIAAALFVGPEALADPDTAWGALSEKLLGPIPGLIGLMLAGVIAGVMSNLAAKSIAVSALFTRNIFRIFYPDASEARGVFVARCTICVVLVIGLVAATSMNNMMSIVQLVITVNVPFGVLIMVMFFWRRATLPAAWTALIVAIGLNVAFPIAGSWIPAMRNSQALAISSIEADGRPAPVYWKTVTRVNKDDPDSALQGGAAFPSISNRFDMENYMTTKLGIVDSAKLTSRQRENLRYYMDAFLPLLVLVIVSLVTRNKDKRQVDFFYGKMKTPVGDTPELDVQAIEETRRDPRRFDHTKLLGKNSSWEFGKWDRQDAVGFIICCAGSGAIILLFWGLLKLASG
jgi:Na+/proline symporter